MGPIHVRFALLAFGTAVLSSGFACHGARAAEYTLMPSPQTVHIGYFSAAAKPVLTANSGDIVTLETASNLDPAEVDFRFEDYRDLSGTFDRVVSVGMFEHVGVGFYDAFFRKCAELLRPDGVMLLHSIGRAEGPSITNPFIAKYIFPGGYIPALSEVLPAIERAGLLVTDIEILRLHYAETLRAWRERFLAHREEFERLYDDRFCRMWEFYLASSEMSFRQHGMMVFQIQLSRRQGVVPITRDYIMRDEARLRACEGDRRLPLRLAGE